MDEDPATTPPNEEHLVRHRRRRRHSFRPESEELARRREDLRALSWILPLCLLGLGALLLFLVTRNPEPAERPAGLVEIAWALLGAGVVWLALALAWSWIAAVRRWCEENGGDHHRRHRHHR